MRSDARKHHSATFRVSRRADVREFWTREGCFVRESWQQAMDEEVSVMRLRVPAHARTELQSLEGVACRYLVQEGRGRLDIDARLSFEVSADDVVYVESGTRSAWINEGDGDLIIYRICTPPFHPECVRPATPGAVGRLG